MNTVVLAAGSAGFSPITSTDKAGNLWIMTILALIYTSMVAAARICIKHRMYGLDDVLMAFSVLLHLAEAAAIFVALNSGTGKLNSLTSPSSLAVSSRAFLAAECLYVLSLASAKCSLLALIFRIIGTNSGRSRLVCFVLLGLSASWGLASCLTFTINCRADTLFTTGNKMSCSAQHTRWIIITAADNFTELVSWLLIVTITSAVNMSFKRKCQVVLAFSFRLFLILLSTIHLKYFSHYPASPQPQFAITTPLLIQQVTIVWSIISATIPNLKNFLKSFSIGMGFPIAFEITGFRSSNAYPLEAVDNSQSAAEVSKGTVATPISASAAHHNIECWSDRPVAWRSDEMRHHSLAVRQSLSAVHGTEEEDKVSRNGSQEMIINKEVVWDVTYERRQ